MKTIPAELLADLKSDSTSLALIWTIEMSDGRMIRGTEHDLDIIIPASGASPPDKYAGTYYAVANVTMGDIASTSDLSIDNLDVTGAFPDKGTDSPLRYTVLDVTVDEIESGLLDQAPVTIMACNWKNPAHGYWIAKVGTLGTINRDSDGKYTTEVRGLTQQLAQTIIRTFSVSCNVVKFGDNRCRFAVPTSHGEVTEIDNRLQFSVSIDADSPPSTNQFSYVGGTLTFTTGANTGFFREIKLDPLTNGNVVQFWDQFPETISVYDTFDITPGCDRQLSTCRDVYNNLQHFRGFGAFIPGVNALTQGPIPGAEFP